MKHFLILPTIALSSILAAVAIAVAPVELRAQEKEFLTSSEIDSLRDAQDASNRVSLYLAFARKRIEEVKEKTSSNAEDAGEWIQERLDEYTAILDALEESLQAAREQRAALGKPIKQMESDMSEFDQYLENLRYNKPDNLEDYKFTLDEAIETTGEELADARKGAFPEVKDRTPPTDLPARPPRAGASGASAPKDKPPSNSSGSTGEPSSPEGDGPPRKRQASPSAQPSSDGDSSQDGPPRKPTRNNSQNQ